MDQLITWADSEGKSFAGWDQQVEVMELPRIYRTNVETIPASVPYLFVDSERLERSRALLGARRRPKIGLLWGASSWNPLRSVPLEELLPILRLRDFDFYSFQRGPQREELEGLDCGARVHDTALHSAEIADTAADLMNMDLLITVDTMAAHLAGALGRPVWVLLPYEADWRWMLDRSDSPWYPTMRLFRQKARQDWRTPVSEILEALADTGRVADRLDAQGSLAVAGREDV